MSDSDGLLMRQVQAGDVGTFAALVARHQSPMFRYAVSKLGCRGLAEDAVQETFLAAYRYRDGYDPSRPFRAWLWTILQNTCVRFASRGERSRVVAGVAGIVDRRGEDTVERASIDAEQRSQLYAALERLPREQADAVRMRFFGQLAFDEIGAALGCPTATAKSRVRYGLEKLAGLLRDLETAR